MKRGLLSLVALTAAVVLVVLVIQVARSNRERDEALAAERHSYDILVVIRGLDAAMARSEAALGRFVISGEQPIGTLYYDEWRRAGAQLRRLRSLTFDDPKQTELVGQLEQAYATRGRELADPATRATYRQGWPALSLFNDAGKSRTIPELARLMERIAANERTRLGVLSDEAQIRVDRSNDLARWLSVLGVFLTLGAIALGWMAALAVADRQRAKQIADEEADRADTLEVAVAARTAELSDANEALRQEAMTRASAEAQLRQVQKMEAVGQLTGGIAHDFNNMLAVVVGGLDLARRRLQTEHDEVERHIDSAMDGAKRAAALTRRLLAFARSEPLLPEGIVPGRLIRDMAELFERTLGERIVLDYDVSASLWQVWCDPNQLENAILNLAVNARDAMGGEGRLGIATTNVSLADGEVGVAPAGDYVRIAVTDGGCGMTPEVQERVFEPFFTTKPVGKGTGLGLSQIFGFARQSGGDVAIRSVVGDGTTVSLYLPRHVAGTRAEPALLRAVPDAVPAPAGPATILIVEDDLRVRAATVAAIEELGHDALPCGGGEEALALLAEHRDIDLVVTDVVMPGMTGPQLVAEIDRLYPEQKVLFVTGYVGDAGDADQFRGHEVLRKPFTVAALAAAVNHALGGRTIGRAA